MAEYICITESALDIVMMHELWELDGYPQTSTQYGLGSAEVGKGVRGYYSYQEKDAPYFALINCQALSDLLASSKDSWSDIYRRIARVVKALKSPPIHLPRQWSEYHYKNLITFFALPRSDEVFRWVADTHGEKNCVRFLEISTKNRQIDLTGYISPEWPVDFNLIAESLKNNATDREVDTKLSRGLSSQVDLNVIGGGSVVRDRRYEEWLGLLSDPQKSVLAEGIDESIRIVGAAGSGKTLALCLRALQVSRDEEVRYQGKKILIATHSWAMAERIDSILTVLNSGEFPDHVTVFPLQVLLQMHAGQIGQQRTEVIGDDSTHGRIKSLEIIKDIIGNGKVRVNSVSDWISEGIEARDDSRKRLNLLFNLYEEISGVLTASSLALDDQDSIDTYISADREEWMPPFTTVDDRIFVIAVYREFIRVLIDRASITTDQFVLDAIRVLETFTWRMRKETDGYDYIFVDELQLFDSQERSALELLGRSRKGVPFITAEDPSQGIFSGLHSKRTSYVREAVYLDTVHRFDKGIFEFIKYIYQKFPLNVLPLRIDDKKLHSAKVPQMVYVSKPQDGVERIGDLVERIFGELESEHRVCVATLGDVDEQICEVLEAKKLSFTQLTSFDDVEKLSYRKKSIIVSPWQFIGGTQFSHVIVAAINMAPAVTAFGKRHELTAIYLSSSRATQNLSIVCSGYVPQVVNDAKEAGLISMVN